MKKKKLIGTIVIIWILIFSIFVVVNSNFTYNDEDKLKNYKEIIISYNLGKDWIIDNVNKEGYFNNTQYIDVNKSFMYISHKNIQLR